jgi:hypothetical protein
VASEALTRRTRVWFAAMLSALLMLAGCGYHSPPLAIRRDNRWGREGLADGG